MPPTAISSPSLSSGSAPLSETKNREPVSGFPIFHFLCVSLSPQRFSRALQTQGNEKGTQCESATIPVAVSSGAPHTERNILQSATGPAVGKAQERGTSQKTCRCTRERIGCLREYGRKSERRSAGTPAPGRRKSPENGSEFWFFVAPCSPGTRSIFLYNTK